MCPAVDPSDSGVVVKGSEAAISSEPSLHARSQMRSNRLGIFDIVWLVVTHGIASRVCAYVIATEDWSNVSDDCARSLEFEPAECYP